MPEIPVDLTNLPEPEAKPEGQYVCQVKSITMKDSKRTPGNKNLEIDYTILEPMEYNGQEIRFDTLSLSEKALFRVRDFVNACNVFPGPEGFKTEELIGAVLRVTLVREPMMTNQVDPSSGTSTLVPRVGKDGKPALRNKVVGYAQR